MSICLKSFLVLAFILIAPISHAEEEWTDHRLHEYFSGLSSEGKKEYIADVTKKLAGELPAKVNDQMEARGIQYSKKLNTLHRHLFVAISYDDIQKTEEFANAMKEFEENQRRSSINSQCTGKLFKMWMFQNDTKLAVDYYFLGGQHMFTTEIDKEDCLAAGYKYEL